MAPPAASPGVAGSTPLAQLAAVVAAEAEHLRSQDPRTAALSAARMASLASTAPDEPAADPMLLTVVPALVALAAEGSASHVAARGNAFAALTHLLDRQGPVARQIVAAGLLPAAVAAVSAPPPASSSMPTDDALVCNALSCLTAASREGETNLWVACEAGAVPAATAVLAAPASTPGARFAAGEFLCTCASESATREMLTAAGAVEAAAAALPATIACASDSSVEDPSDGLIRVLMLLGMLTGGSSERLARLAAADGALAGLLTVGRVADMDAECKALAAALLREVAGNAQLRPSLEAAMRGGVAA